MAKGSWTHYRRNTPSGVVEWVEADDGETIISGSEAREYFPLFAAAPTMLAYIERKASEGDKEAISILKVAYGRG